MRVEVDEPEREMHRMSGSSWRAVMAKVSGEKLRGNLAPRSPGDDDIGRPIYTYLYLCLNPARIIAVFSFTTLGKPLS